ncbi:hypothetical protein [Kineosporia babensis]|uniref:Uncharacterized protein n=1 Tax=Kineosporia babensis TaxID=499548 RepID=A0A9X1SWS5_9ACTN|nr:hypothetical protein [Kineosporia babensis]MCD5309733.1 hypothetical protein [Kineosporia babensis]
MTQKPAMPDVDTVRTWWHELLNGSRSRDEVHALAAPWVEGTAVVSDALADAGLWDLYGANLNHAGDGGFRHGGAPDPVHSMDDLAQQFFTWSESVRVRAEDPQAWAALLLAQRRQMRSARDNLR